MSKREEIIQHTEDLKRRVNRIQNQIDGLTRLKKHMEVAIELAEMITEEEKEEKEMN